MTPDELKESARRAAENSRHGYAGVSHQQLNAAARLAQQSFELAELSTELHNRLNSIRNAMWFVHIASVAIILGVGFLVWSTITC